jgi:hypothetical protein
MDDKSQLGKAIVPEEGTRELALSSEMVHRGLELAVQIERKQGIRPTEPLTITIARKDHLVHGNISLMKWYRDPNGSYKLKEAEKSEASPTVFLWISFDPDGLHFSCASKAELTPFDYLKDNENRYRLLNATHDTNPFTVPMSSLGLYYRIIVPYRPDRYPPGLVKPIPKEEWKNFHFEWGPEGSPGYIGPATREANPHLHIQEDCLKIIIVYISLISDTDPNRKLVSKKPPMKFSFTVIDPNGSDDPQATHDFYQAIFEVKNKKI